MNILNILLAIGVSRLVVAGVCVGLQDVMAMAELSTVLGLLGTNL